ncbi:MAG: prepilin-type N-terminal cleavage/methylation domain-containing protein [Planctomycetota bacterium]
MTGRRAHGMTLLELLLAIAIFASIATMAAAAMAQMRTWADDEVASERLLRVQRVISMMQAQWAERRSTSTVETLEGGVTMTADSVRFLTASPTLFPGWPLVIATYAIEPADTFTEGGAQQYQLIYAETRLNQLDDLPADGEEDRLGRAFEDSIILLDACDALVWERFGRPIGESDAVLRQPEDWRAYEVDFEGTPAAVRLLGVREGEAFGCVLVVKPLR